MPQIFELLQPLQSTGEVVEDHLPYIFCNEQNQLNTLDYLDIWKTNLSVDPARKKSVHIGFSVWFNLDIVATTQPDYAVILDFDPTVHGFLYPAICSALKDCESREEFASVLMKEVCKNPWLLSCQSYLQSRLDDTFTAPCGFLSNQTRYSYVRNFLLKDRLFFGRCDLTSETDMTALANFVKMNNLNLQTLYLSNIPEWICSSDKLAWELTQKMIEEVELFPELLLDAFYPTSLKKGSGPPQRISSGKWPTYEVSKKRSGYSLSFYDQSDNGPMLTSPNAVKKRKLYDDAEKEGLSTPCSF